MAADECSLIVYSVVNLTGAANQRRKKLDYFYCFVSERFALFSVLTLFKQGGGQSAGDGPQQHLQEDEASGGEAGWAVPDSAGDCQRSG